MLNFKKVLIIAAHPDDGELGMGGSITKMLMEGIEINYKKKLKHNKIITIYQLKMESEKFFDKLIIYHDWYSVEKININSFNNRNFK